MPFRMIVAQTLETPRRLGHWIRLVQASTSLAHALSRCIFVYRLAQFLRATVRANGHSPPCPVRAPSLSIGPIIIGAPCHRVHVDGLDRQRVDAA
jgi:hypothetical protein